MRLLGWVKIDFVQHKKGIKVIYLKFSITNFTVV